MQLISDTSNNLYYEYQQIIMKYLTHSGRFTWKIVKQAAKYVFQHIPGIAMKMVPWIHDGYSIRHWHD